MVGGQGVSSFRSHLSTMIVPLSSRNGIECCGFIWNEKHDSERHVLTKKDILAIRQLVWPSKPEITALITPTRHAAFLTSSIYLSYSLSSRDVTLEKFQEHSS